MHNKQIINILIASEFVVFRTGLKSLFEKESSFSIAGEVTNLNEIFNNISKSKPDIIIINLDLQPESLNSLCNNIHFKYPNVSILLFLKETTDISITDLIINGGVKGIIWEENASDDFIEAVRCVANGGSFFEDSRNCRINCHMAHKLCENFEVSNIDELLSSREIEVLKLIGNGKSYGKIAEELMISRRTVETHKNHLIVKLNLKSKYELIRYALNSF